MKKRFHSLLIVLFLLITQTGLSQQEFDRKITTAGNVGIAITNVGTIGKPNVRNDPGGDPSFEFPLDSGQELLFEAGIWLGAQVNGSQILVSTAAVTNSSGFATGKPGFEFTNDGTLIIESSSLVESPLFNPLATSHQDFTALFSDRRTSVLTGAGNSIPIGGHEQPLFADVELKSLNWNFSFTESFSILQYTFTNTSNDQWDSVYVGMYADLVNRNVNSVLDTGGNFFNKNGIGYLDDLYTTYVFDAGSTDDPSLNTYGALSLIGAEYRDRFAHPSNAEFLTSQGFPVPQVGPEYWLFSAGAGVFQAPVDDLDRYSRMAEPFPLDAVREDLRTGGQTSNGNYISFVSIGPFQNVAPNESFTVFFAMTGAFKPEEFQGLGVANKGADDEVTRVELIENLGWVYRTFQGEDENNNGVLDAGEDINNNNVLDRFLIPEPPAVPKLRAELESGSVTLFWDRRAERSIDPVTGERDFEGYKVYRSSLGDDLNGRISNSAQVIAEFDSLGNDVGFNSGFGLVELTTPRMFEGDTTEYWYAYEIDGLLSGWQYQFAVTSFDAGSDRVELESLESSPNANAVRVFPGTPVNENFGSDSEEFKVGVYPNPYRVNAAWDGGNSLQRKLIFYNLPREAEVRIYTLAGEVVGKFRHNADTYVGDIRWFSDFSSDNRLLPGGEHAWDLLSDSQQNIVTGLYLYTVKDLNSGDVQRGKIAIIK